MLTVLEFVKTVLLSCLIISCWLIFFKECKYRREDLKRNDRLIEMILNDSQKKEDIRGKVQHNHRDLIELLAQARKRALQEPERHRPASTDSGGAMLCAVAIVSEDTSPITSSSSCSTSSSD